MGWVSDGSQIQPRVQITRLDCSWWSKSKSKPEKWFCKSGSGLTGCIARLLQCSSSKGQSWELKTSFSTKEREKTPELLEAGYALWALIWCGAWACTNQELVLIPATSKQNNYCSMRWCVCPFHCWNLEPGARKVFQWGYGPCLGCCGVQTLPPSPQTPKCHLVYPGPVSWRVTPGAQGSSRSLCASASRLAGSAPSVSTSWQ